MFLKLLLSSSLTIIVAAAFLTDDQIITISQEELNRISIYIVPQHYDTIVTYIEKNILIINSSIRTQIKYSTPSIILYLHVKNINLTVVYYPNYYSMNDIKTTNIYTPVRTMYDVEKNIVEYTFAEDLFPGYYIIKLVYNITEDTGLKNFYKRDGRQWLATYVDRIGIQHMIPTLPESSGTIMPYYKPIYDIIVEHYQNYTVLSNERKMIEKIEMNDKNMTKTHFNTLVKPMYLLFLTNRNFSLMPGTNESVRVNMWCRMHCEFAHQFAENITLYVFDKWKRLNQTWEINHIALPDFQNESITNLGLIFYKEADIIYNDNVDSVATKIKVRRFMAYKIIEECFYYGNPLWPSYMFDEAVVSFLGLYVTTQTLPSTRMMDLFVVQIQQDSFHLDTVYYTSLYNTSFDIYFQHYSYIKVSSILRLLRMSFTEEIFWQIIRTYVKDNKPYFHYLSEVIKNSSIQMHTDYLFDITELLMSPSKINYCPVVKMERDYNFRRFNVMMTYTVEKPYDFIPVTSDTWNGDFIIYNRHQIGYYRVNYDIENWRRIISYLNSESYMYIYVLNRAQIIDDAFHLMITNQLNSIVFWNITKYLSRETDYVAWYPMFKALEYLSNIFLFQENIYVNIKDNMLYLLNNLLNKLKYDEVSSEYDLIKSLRMEAARWACNLDSETCIKSAQLNLNRHLKDPGNNMLLPWWKEWTYCQGLKMLNYSLSNKDSFRWRVYLENEKFKTKFLKYLSCPAYSQFINPYLNLIKNDSTTSIMFFKDFSDKNYINYFFLTIAKHARKPVVLDFILENLENIRPRQVSEHATFIVIINHVYSINQLKKISNLAESYKRKATYLPIYSNIYQYVLNIQSKIRRRNFEIKCQKDYFQNFMKYQ
ncbi:aminopeptidase N-like isoform X2 [Camponotus floridanus]|uniref:aminopeptidase N-like isoform X2 n=1 Tax=Camponotus floridanus TaxID=104421 RepID=UPI000DC6A985|nr:aminopeptidase N-like isoform X2 [Camponotus floridanus]